MVKVGGIAFMAGLLLGGALVFAIHDRSPGQEEQDLRHSLEDVTEQLQLARRSNDSLRGIDSAHSALASAARDSVAIHAPDVAAADAALAAAGGTATVTDTAAVDVLQGPATDSAWVTIRDTSWRVPLPVAQFTKASVDYIAQVKPQLARYAVALHADTLALATKDERIQGLMHADSLAQQQDKDHRALEDQFIKDERSAFRRGVKAGLKGTLYVATVAIVVVKSSW
jgi:hypothetical protein